MCEYFNKPFLFEDHKLERCCKKIMLEHFLYHNIDKNLKNLKKLNLTKRKKIKLKKQFK